MAHARRHFANAIKAIGKSNPKAVESSVAYKALVRIGAIYNLEGALKELTPEERLKERQASIKPLVEEFFSWLRKIQAVSYTHLADIFTSSTPFSSNIVAY